MSVLDGPGEGTWSVFAAKVVAERDEARAETARLRRLLNMAEDELIAADDHGRREAKRADTVEAEVEALKAERDEARAEAERLHLDVGCLQLGLTVASEAYRAGYMAGSREAFRRGAEVMRDDCDALVRTRGTWDAWELSDQIEAMSIPEDK